MDAPSFKNIIPLLYTHIPTKRMLHCILTITIDDALSCILNCLCFVIIILFF